MDLFTVSISVSVDAKKWVQHPNLASASASTLFKTIVKC